ncbi:MAG: transketolase [Candidatus Woesearchaeota archaeon]|jgi:transketolase|nr:transketolase [Candidatus Woesearchaeota archaeon]
MNLKDLKLKSNDIRKDIVLMLNKAKSGHSAGAIGLTDIFTTLYFDNLKHDPKKPNKEDRDFVILSNGHICPVLYATLAHSGYFPKKELLSLRKLGSRLQGHPHNNSLPGIENSSGPLGQGLSQAVGLAASLKRDKKKNKVYCFVGDGELNEGQIWESLLFAGKEKLDNLIIIVDRNFIQIDGNTEFVLPLEPLNKKFTAFNCKSIEFNGNDIKQIKHVFKEIKKLKGKPIVLIAKTTPGKNISFMEGKSEWHGKVPNDEEAKQAIKELEAIELKIKRGEF